MFVFVSQTTAYQDKLSFRWKSVEHTLTRYLPLSVVQMMISQIPFPLCQPQLLKTAKGSNSSIENKKIVGKRIACINYYKLHW